MDGQVVFVFCLIAIPSLTMVMFIGLSITRRSTIRIRGDYDKLLKEYKDIVRKVKGESGHIMTHDSVEVIEFQKHAEGLYDKYCRCNRETNIDYGWNKGIRHVKEAIFILDYAINEFDVKRRRENKIGNLLDDEV